MRSARQAGARFSRGGVAAEDFYRLANEARAKEMRSFDPTRYFCANKELVHFGGRTYVFLNQWGGSDWKQALVNLREVFSDKEIEFTPSE